MRAEVGVPTNETVTPMLHSRSLFKNPPPTSITLPLFLGLAFTVLGVVLACLGTAEWFRAGTAPQILASTAGSAVLLALTCVTCLWKTIHTQSVTRSAWTWMAGCVLALLALTVTYGPRQILWTAGEPPWVLFDALHTVAMACCALALVHFTSITYRQSYRRFLDACTLSGAATMMLWATPYGQAVLDHTVAASLTKAAQVTMFFVVSTTCLVTILRRRSDSPACMAAATWWAAFCGAIVIAIVGTFGVVVHEGLAAVPLAAATVVTITAARTTWPQPQALPPAPAPALLANVAIIAAILALWIQSTQTTKYMSIAIGQIAVLSLIVTIRNSLSGWEITDLLRMLRRREQQLAYDASHDPLTGLTNRREFHNQLTAALSYQARKPVHLAFLDLDGFKAINDSYGHGAGDEVLVRFADMLVAKTPADSVCGRLNGDEFAVFFHSDQDPSHIAKHIGQSLTDSLGDRTEFRTLTASIGVATAAPGDPITAEELIYRADLAMYVVKHDRRNGFAIHSPTLAGPFFDDRVLGPALHDAVHSGAIKTYYQPIYDLRNKTISGFEALSRWEHEGATITPDRFISLAERGGVIDDLTWLVLSRVVTQLHRWENSARRYNLDVSINISGPSLNNPHLIDQIIDLTTRFDVDPNNLTIEVTESEPIRDIAAASQLLVKARSHGIHVSLDDFGTGCNSIAHLLQLPLSKAKIDPSMTRGIEHDHDRAAVVSGMVALAKQRGLIVVAEGVENPQQQALLHKMGVDYIQGYLIGRPSPAEQWDSIVRQEVVTLPKASYEANASSLPGE